MTAPGSPRDAKPGRRGWMIAAAGGAAAAAGGAWSWWRLKPEAGEVPADFWQMQFTQPFGGELTMASLRGRPLLINFWATWCPPCVKEMPQIDRFHRDFSSAGWQVLGLAVDGPTPVREFLKKTPVGFHIGLAGLEGTDLSRRLGNSAGALPFTVVLDAEGRAIHRKLGETSYDELSGWAKTG